MFDILKVKSLTLLKSIYETFIVPNKNTNDLFSGIKLHL